MKKTHLYKISIEDESHLRTLAEVKVSPLRIVAASLCAIILLIIIGGLLVMFTPLRGMLPGYMDNNQRVATEENLLRLDSLQEAYLANKNYIDNYLRVLDTDRIPSDSIQSAGHALSAVADSLLPAGERESRFTSLMEERERFNISVLAPLAADAMAFSPICSDGIFTAQSKQSEVGEVIMPEGESVRSIADGIAVDVHHSAIDGGYTLIVQHDRGFLSAYTGTGSPLVACGDALNSGQVIALAPAPDRHGDRRIGVMMWHNGLPLVPYQYVGLPLTSTPEESSYEAPRGR